jgi:hypothetical protein
MGGWGWLAGKTTELAVIVTAVWLHFMSSFLITAIIEKFFTLSFFN